MNLEDRKRLRIMRFEPFDLIPGSRLLARGAVWPDGSTVVGFRYAGGGVFELKLRHSDWPAVPEGGVIPTFPAPRRRREV